MNVLKKRFLLYGTLGLCMGICGCGTQEELSMQENIEENGDFIEETENSLEEQNDVIWLGSMKDDTVEGDFFMKSRLKRERIIAYISNKKKTAILQKDIIQLQI